MASKQKKSPRKKLSADEKLAAAANRRNERLMADSHAARDVFSFPRTEVLDRANLVWLAGGAVPRENVFSCPETEPIDQRGATRLFRTDELPDFAPSHVFVKSGWQAEDYDPEGVEDRLIETIDEQRELERERAHRAFYFLVSDRGENPDLDPDLDPDHDLGDDENFHSTPQNWRAKDEVPLTLGRTSVKVLARRSDGARARRKWPTAPRGPEE